MKRSRHAVVGFSSWQSVDCIKNRVRPSLTAVPAIYSLHFLRFCLYIVLDAIHRHRRLLGTRSEAWIVQLNSAVEYFQNLS